MSLPKPLPGLVLRYSYLWYREHLDGREEGQKDRPCAIVAAIRTDDTGETRVLVLPVTHTPPDHASLAIEIPPKVKQRLRLDDARSWIVLSEWNEFVWPWPRSAPPAGRRRSIRGLRNAAPCPLRNHPGQVPYLDAAAHDAPGPANMMGLVPCPRPGLASSGGTAGDGDDRRT